MHLLIVISLPQSDILSDNSWREFERIRDEFMNEMIVNPIINYWIKGKINNYESIEDCLNTQSKQRGGGGKDKGIKQMICDDDDYDDDDDDDYDDDYDDDDVVDDALQDDDDDAVFII